MAIGLHRSHCIFDSIKRTGLELFIQESDCTSCTVFLNQQDQESFIQESNYCSRCRFLRRTYNKNHLFCDKTGGALYFPSELYKSRLFEYGISFASVENVKQL